MIGLAGMAPRILAAQLPSKGWPPAVVELFRRDFLTADAVWWACRNDPGEVQRLADTVTRYGTGPSASQQTKRRAREVAAWITNLTEETS